MRTRWLAPGGRPRVEFRISAQYRLFGPHDPNNVDPVEDRTTPRAELLTIRAIESGGRLIRCVRARAGARALTGVSVRACWLCGVRTRVRERPRILMRLLPRRPAILS